MILVRLEFLRPGVLLQSRYPFVLWNTPAARLTSTPLQRGTIVRRARLVDLLEADYGLIFTYYREFFVKFASNRNMWNKVSDRHRKLFRQRIAEKFSNTISRCWLSLLQSPVEAAMGNRHKWSLKTSAVGAISWLVNKKLHLFQISIDVARFCPMRLDVNLILILSPETPPTVRIT